MRVFAWLLSLFGLILATIGLVAWLPFASPRLDLVGVVFFVVTGTLFYLAGTWFGRRLPPEKTRKFVLRPNDISFITNMLTRERRMYLAFGLFLLAFDALMVFAVLSGDDSKPAAHPVFVMAMGIFAMLLFAAVAIASLYKSFTLRDVLKTPIYGLLTKTPHLVTGMTAHMIQHEHAPGKAGRQILVELSTSRSEKLRILVSEEQHSLLKQYIQLHSPQASYDEKEQRVSH